MVVVDGGHAQEHEDDRLARAAQHLHRVFQRRLRFGADVALHVVLHGDAAESDAERKRHVFFSLFQMQYTRNWRIFQAYDVVKKETDNSEITRHLLNRTCVARQRFFNVAKPYYVEVKQGFNFFPRN